MGKIALNYIYLSPEHAGGKDQVGLNLLKGFQENGYVKDMCIICFEYSIQLIKSISQDIQIIAFKIPKIHSELQRMGIISFVNTFLIPKVIKNNNIDLIYHLSYNTGLIKQKVPTVVIPHDIKAVAHRKLVGISVPFYKYLIYRFVYYIDFKNCKGIIAISDVDKKEIAQYYPAYANKIHKIYNPIDISLPCKRRENIENVIVAINLQFHHKNIITLIRAFEAIADQTDVNLILIGNVPKRVEYLKEYVIKHNLQKRVIFTGFISEKKRNDILKSCKLYINPTLYEGFGMTAIEAMILKIPTLISNIETNYEVTLGKAEYYSPPDDYLALASKILYCLSKKRTDEEMAEKSLELYKKYNYKFISKIYMDYFNTIVGKIVK